MKKIFMYMLATPLGFLLGFSAVQVSFGHYYWLFGLIPSIIYITWYFYNIFKELNSNK